MRDRNVDASEVPQRHVELSGLCHFVNAWQRENRGLLKRSVGSEDGIRLRNGAGTLRGFPNMDGLVALSLGSGSPGLRHTFNYQNHHVCRFSMTFI